MNNDGLVMGPAPNGVERPRNVMRFNGNVADPDIAKACGVTPGNIATWIFNPDPARAR